MRQPRVGTAPLCRRQGIDTWEVAFGCATSSYSQKALHAHPQTTPLQQHRGYCQTPRDLLAEQCAGGSQGGAPSPYPCGLASGHSMAKHQANESHCSN